MMFQRRSVSWGWIVATCVACALLATSQKSGLAQDRAAIPSVARQKEIAKDLEDAYNLSRLESASKKQDAVKKLLDASRVAVMPDDERYVVLTVVQSPGHRGTSWQCRFFRVSLAANYPRLRRP